MMDVPLSSVLSARFLILRKHCLNDSFKQFLHSLLIKKIEKGHRNKRKRPTIVKPFKVIQYFCEETQQNESFVSFPRYIYFKYFNLNDPIIDTRTIGLNFHVKSIFRGKLRKNGIQEPATTEVLSKLKDDLHGNMALLELYCGAGKTFCALFIAYVLQLKTLVLIHKSDFITQWSSSAKNLIPYIKIHVLTSKSTIDDILENDIIICTYQLLMRGTFDSDFFTSVGFCILDECHHIAAEKFSLCMDYINAKHILGLSATPIRSDGLTEMIFYLTGPIVYRAERPYQRVNIDVHRFEEGNERIVYDKSNEVSHVHTNQALMRDKTRNKHLVDLFIKRLKENHVILALSTQCDHITKIMKMVCEQYAMQDNDAKIFHCATGKFFKHKFIKKTKEIVINIPKQNEEEENEEKDEQIVQTEDGPVHIHTYWKCISTSDFGFRQTDFEVLSKWLFQYTYLRRLMPNMTTKFIENILIKKWGPIMRIGQRVGNRTTAERKIQVGKESWMGTYANCSEGLDIVELTNIIMLVPAEGHLDQIVGRALRKEENDFLVPTIDDVRDPFSVYLGRFSKRHTQYKKKKYTISFDTFPKENDFEKKINDEEPHNEEPHNETISLLAIMANMGL
jgi:superfamily II DNA or RNA helicase